MPISINQIIGADLNNVIRNADALANPAINIPHKLGVQTFGDDGRVYVFARANAVIAANTAVCTVSPITFLATATGGAYLAPAIALAVGDYAWFGRAGV